MYNLSFENVPTCEFIMVVVAPVTLLNIFPITSHPQENRYLYHGSSFEFGHANNSVVIFWDILTSFVLPSGKFKIVPSPGNIPASTTFPELSTTGTHEPEP